MTTIYLQTLINASVEEVFDCARSIDFHMRSASKTQEKAIAGRTKGLIGMGDTVIWRGRHFGLLLKHTSKILEFKRPHKFTDVMLEGHFSYFVHEHVFQEEGGSTLMIDSLKYRVPFGFLGTLFDKMILKSHLTRFLQTRNKAIRLACEHEQNPEVVFGRSKLSEKII